MKKPTISNIHVETGDGYRCRADVTLGGETRRPVFVLLVPHDAAISIGEGPMTKNVVRVFTNYIEQAVENGVMRSYPRSAKTVDLGTLDARQIGAALLKNVA